MVSFQDYVRGIIALLMSANRKTFANRWLILLRGGVFAGSKALTLGYAGSWICWLFDMLVLRYAGSSICWVKFVSNFLGH